jgi:hypothetical protein
VFGMLFAWKEALGMSLKLGFHGGLEGLVERENICMGAGKWVHCDRKDVGSRSGQRSRRKIHRKMVENGQRRGRVKPGQTGSGRVGLSWVDPAEGRRRMTSS